MIAPVTHRKGFEAIRLADMTDDLEEAASGCGGLQIIVCGNEPGVGSRGVSAGEAAGIQPPS